MLWREQQLQHQQFPAGDQYIISDSYSDKLQIDGLWGNSV